MRVSSDALAGLLRPPPPRPKQPTARERAAANRLNVLRAVAEHGSLRCSDLAAACWPGARYGEQMSQRTVRALLETGELKARRNSLGGISFVCTRPGAAALEVRGIASAIASRRRPSISDWPCCSSRTRGRGANARASWLTW